MKSFKGQIEKLSKNVDYGNYGNSTKQKWFTFTYVRREAVLIIKLFKHTKLNIAFKTNSSLEHNLQTVKRCTHKGDK
jgi:hypothetical protein